MKLEFKFEIGQKVLTDEGIGIVESVFCRQKEKWYWIKLSDDSEMWIHEDSIEDATNSKEFAITSM